MDLNKSFKLLEDYMIKEDYMGYDPYDTLNSWIPFQIFGKWGPIIATQTQKRNPINIRNILGIKKEYNPKAMGLLLSAYSILYNKTEESKYLDKANFFYNWLINNYSKEYDKYSWGYNFPWASSKKYVNGSTPSSVVSGFVVKGMYEYYKVSGKKEIKDIIKQSSLFIKNSLAWTKDDTGYCISYTPVERDICYNASLLAAEILAINYLINGDENYKKYSIDCVNYVVSRQKDTGAWAYSENTLTGKERMQIDFHQGYILESIFNIKTRLQIDNAIWDSSIVAGLKYYHTEQFHKNGRSFWRIPKEYPTDIHNQSQGIITFKLLAEYDSKLGNVAKTILEWTIDNMQDPQGYFYYRNFKFYRIKTPFMRWSQAWMLLAMSNLIEN